MPNLPKQYAELLDQLLPFLAASPTWFKGWIYVFIFLTFATVAATGIFYLINKEQKDRESSWNAFQIERPTQDQEIGRTKTRNWMLEGTFPKFDQSELQRTARIDVQVYKLPSGEPILPQLGTPRVSTADGHWSFEFANFPELGSYEIVVTGYGGQQNAVRRVRVTCLEKAEAYRNAIQLEADDAWRSNDRTIQGRTDFVAGYI